MFETYRMRRRVSELSFAESWGVLHALARTGLDQDRKLMVALADRCVEIAPRQSLRAASEGWSNAYRRGSRVRFKSSPVTILEPVNEDLVNAVEEAFDEAGEER